jgi:hypothetical protein
LKLEDAMECEINGTREDENLRAAVLTAGDERPKYNRRVWNVSTVGVT